MQRHIMNLTTIACAVVLLGTGCAYDIEAESTENALHRRGHCMTLAGPFESEIVPCQDQNGLLCTSGTLGGNMHGATYDFTAHAFSGTFPVDGFAGMSLIAHDEGLLFGNDEGTLDVITGAFQTNIMVTGGTGDFSGTIGYIMAVGTADLEVGETTGTFLGVVCSRN